MLANSTLSASQKVAGPFWSHGSNSQAGVAIIVKTSFLGQFHTVDEGKDWEEVEKGRIAILHLKGPQGSLDLVVCYLQAGSGCQETQDRMRASAKLEGPSAQETKPSP